MFPLMFFGWHTFKFLMGRASVSGERIERKANEKINQQNEAQNGLIGLGRDEPSN